MARGKQDLCTVEVSYTKNKMFIQVIPPSSGLIDYAVSMRPDYHRAVIDTITFYGWKNVIYVYDSHDGEHENILLKKCLYVYMYVCMCVYVNIFFIAL